MINDDDDLSSEDVVLARPELLAAYDELECVLARSLPEPDHSAALDHLYALGRLIGRRP